MFLRLISRADFVWADQIIQHPGNIFDLLGNHMGDAAFALNPPCDPKRAPGYYRAAKFLVHFTPDNHVCNPRLVFQSDENHAFGSAGIRWDFYDLDPFSSAAVSPVTGRAATPGTDRRCEVSFDGDHVADGEQAVTGELKAEGINTVAEVPELFPAQPGARLVAARQLTPRRVAVVQVGLRNGANGPETFLSVERLHPLEVVE